MESKELRKWQNEQALKRFTMISPLLDEDIDEEEILEDFAIVENAVSENSDSSLWKNLILISHNPPKGQLCDKVNPVLHAGSQKFTDYILKNQPLAVICGHIHEGIGVEKIGETTVINPGSLGEGNYAWLEIEKKDDCWTVVRTDLCKL